MIHQVSTRSLHLKSKPIYSSRKISSHKNLLIATIIVSSFLLSFVISRADAARGLNRHAHRLAKTRDIHIDDSETNGQDGTITTIDNDDILAKSNSINHHRESIAPKKVQYECGRSMSSKKENLIDIDDGESGHKLKRKYKPMEFRRPRIVGGDETRPGEFPWIVSMQ